MLDLIKEAQFSNISPVFDTLPADALHHSSDASRCASNIIISHGVESFYSEHIRSLKHLWIFVYTELIKCI